VIPAPGRSFQDVVVGVVAAGKPQFLEA